jgi:hypothetical protein
MSKEVMVNSFNRKTPVSTAFNKSGCIFSSNAEDMVIHSGCSISNLIPSTPADNTTE